MSNTSQKNYNARWYDPALGRFAQADSIIPPGVQGLDRYAYVNNSPMNYVDPSGHEPGNHCDRGYCDGDGNVIMANPLMGCRIHCNQNDIEEATLEERAVWFAWLRNDMTERFGNNLGDWFLNISTVVAGFIATGQNSNEWVMNVDAAILAGVSQGYSAYIANPTTPSTGLTNGGKEWFTFFQMFDRDQPNRDLINQWGVAERAGTKDGTDQFGNAQWHGWTNPSLSDDRVFEIIGGVYRNVQATYCGTTDCTNTFFDPRATDATIFGSDYQFSPVWRVLAPIYFTDYMLGQ